MDVTARLSAHGQLHLPDAVLAALGLDDGDEVVFRIEGHRALVFRRDVVDLTTTSTNPTYRRAASWDEKASASRSARSATRR